MPQLELPQLDPWIIFSVLPAAGLLNDPDRECHVFFIMLIRLSGAHSLFLARELEK